MTSFDSATFLELSNDGYTAWPKSYVALTKKIPGGADNVIQKIGTAASRATIPALMTAAELTAMYGKVGTSGSLVFLYETCTATLETIDTPISVGIDNDIYLASLTFRRSSAPTSGGIPANARLTESGDVRLTESGDIRIVE